MYFRYFISQDGWQRERRREEEEGGGEGERVTLSAETASGE